MILVEIFGFVGGSLTIACTIPQIMKSWKTRKVEDISFTHQFMMLLGCSCWVVYGLLMNSMSVIITNLVFFGFVSFMTFLTAWYRK